MSRAPHEPTAESRQQARSLAAVGLPHEDIAVIIGCSEKTLRKHYRDELDEGAADANAAIVGFLMAAIKKGNVAAMIFFEKAQGGKRETIREEVFGPGDTMNGKAHDTLPCNGRGPCPRRAADYKPGDENLEPLGMSDAEKNAEVKRIMVMAEKIGQ
jgi:hypothetical protein